MKGSGASNLPLSCDIVLVGGGHTHALVLRAWGMAPLPGVRLTLINPAPTAPYTGMLPGFVAGHYQRNDLEIDLVRLARFAGARVIFDRATNLDRDTKEIHFAARPPISYDFASIDIGITSQMPEIKGFSEFAIAAKPLGPFANRWHAHIENGAGPVSVIGGGIAGVELALAMRHRIGDGVAIHLIDRGTILTGVGAGTAVRLRSALEAADISIFEHVTPTEIRQNEIGLSDGRTLRTGLVVGAAGARPFPWLEQTGLPLEDGYIAVDQHLRSIGDEAVFAVGDCAHLSHAPRPKAGVFAVRAAPTLLHNLKAAAAGTRLKRFKPQKHYLKLVSLGKTTAVADKWNRAVAGPWVWRWKDRIDRAFMQRLNAPGFDTDHVLPKMVAQGSRTEDPLCAGCGAKVGGDVLSRVLAGLTTPGRPDIETKTGDDAAVLKFGETRQVMTTDHLRAFWEDPYVFAKIAALHALGDVWAMGATPQSALISLTMPRQTAPLQERWLQEVMSAASEVFANQGAAIIGGHSTQGQEMVLGFTVTGLSNTPLKLNGAKAGDRLLLTRAIGSGTLFAAEMAGRAGGDDIEALLNCLTMPQGDAAEALKPFASAMTDVTGFGLAGHAQRMAAASGTGVEITSGEVPVFQGAQELANAGIRSSIWAENLASTGLAAPDTPEGALLFDPQTAGGLLAAVPADLVDQARVALAATPHKAALIGHMTENTPGRLQLR